eukprot:g61262.t1
MWLTSYTLSVFKIGKICLTHTGHPLYSCVHMGHSDDSAKEYIMTLASLPGMQMQTLMAAATKAGGGFIKQSEYLKRRERIKHRDLNLATIINTSNVRNTIDS